MGLLQQSRGSAFGKFAAFCVIAGTMLPDWRQYRSPPVALHFHQLGAAVVAGMAPSVCINWAPNTVDRDGASDRLRPCRVLAGGVHRETGGRVPAIGFLMSIRVLHVGGFYPPARGGMERVLQVLAESERRGGEPRARRQRTSVNGA